MNLAAFQATSTDLYTRYPKSVLVAFIIVVAIGSVRLFHFLFITPPPLRKDTDTESAPPPFNIANVERMEVHIHQGGQVMAAPALAPSAQAPTPPIATASPLAENGGFEDGTLGWGTGFYESYFASPPGSALRFKRAVAEWYIDDKKPHTGKRSLRIEHSTTQAADVFSSFSQRIKVKAGQRYEVTYWAYLESTDGRGSFSLRVLPSRNIQPGEWDRFRRKIDPALIGRWQKQSREFESGSDTFFDLRFAAETKMKLWVDDVVVLPLTIK